jgi:hypothetical protein
MPTLPRRQATILDAFAYSFHRSYGQSSPALSPPQSGSARLVTWMFRAAITGSSFLLTVKARYLAMSRNERHSVCISLLSVVICFGYAGAAAQSRLEEQPAIIVPQTLKDQAQDDAILATENRLSNVQRDQEVQRQQVEHVTGDVDDINSRMSRDEGVALGASAALGILQTLGLIAKFRTKPDKEAS